MSDKIKRCAFCRSEPYEVHLGYVGACRRRCPPDCFNAGYEDCDIKKWNKAQERSLEWRRKDFEAGARYVNVQMLEVQDQIPPWNISKAFDAFIGNKKEST